MNKLILAILLCAALPVHAAEAKHKQSNNDSVVQNILNSHALLSPPEQISDEKKLSDYKNSWVYSWQSADEHWRKEIIGVGWGQGVG